MVGFAAALERTRSGLVASRERMRDLEAAFLASLKACDLVFAHSGAEAPRAPGVLNLAFAGIASHDLVVGMDLAGYAISAGSACSSGVIEPSHVLEAMKLDAWQVEGGVRISFGEANTPDQARDAGRALGELAQRLRTEAAAFSTS
jgi:cysteine desulfurase